MSKKQTALVTGSNGFIGKHLCDKLLNEGFKVAQFPRTSLFDYNNVVKVLDEVKPDYIFHLAAYGNHSTQQDENQIFISNVLATFFLLSANIKHKAKFINISSSSVYGNTKMKETMLPLTKSFYGVTKLSGEYLGNAFNYKYGFNVVNIRPGSVYGIGEADDRFIPTIVRKIIKDETLMLEKKQTHDWIYIDDFVTAVFKLRDKTGTYNVATGNCYTNFYIYETVRNIMGSNFNNVKLVDNIRIDQPELWRLNINKLSEVYKPKVSIEEGLFKTVTNYVALYAQN